MMTIGAGIMKVMMQENCFIFPLGYNSTPECLEPVTTDLIMRVNVRTTKYLVPAMIRIFFFFFFFYPPADGEK